MEKIYGFTLTKIFEQASIGKWGVSFEKFASAPMTTLQSVGQDDAVDIMRAGFCPLLPVLVKLQWTLEAKWQQDGHPAEPYRRCRNLTHRLGVSMVCGHRSVLAA